MVDRVVNCHVEPGTLRCAFMPTALDSRSHQKLRFKRPLSSSASTSEVLSSSHPQNSKIKVEGTRFNPKSSRYAIGVMQEGSDDLFVYEASSFSVQALVDGVVVRHSESDQQAGSYQDKKKELINTYAPVKKQRQLRAAVNAIVSDEKIEGYDESMEAMKQSLKAAAEAAEEKGAVSEQQTGILGQMRDLLPPFDLSASTPGAIYDFSVLFPETLVAALDPSDTESTCHALLRWIHEDFRPVMGEDDQFAEVKRMKVLSQLGRLYFAAKQEKRKNFAKLLNILVSMILLFRLKRKKGWSAFDVYATDPLAQRLGELYSPDKCIGGTIDREGGNKLFAHIALFTLRLTPYWEFDFSDLKIDLNVQSKDLLAILGFSGISTKQSAGKSGLVGTLKAPLVVPTSFGPKRGAPKRK